MKERRTERRVVLCVVVSASQFESQGRPQRDLQVSICTRKEGQVERGSKRGKESDGEERRSERKGERERETELIDTSLACREQHSTIANPTLLLEGRLPFKQ